MFFVAGSFLRPTDVLRDLPVRRGDILADFGTGQGHIATALALRVGEAGTVYAIDIINRMIESVRKEAQRRGLHNIHVIKGDLERLGGSTLKEGAVHGVVIVNVLFQAEKPKAVIEEAARIVRSGGWCAVVDWVTARDGIGSFGPPNDRLIRKDDVVGWAQKLGFSLEREINAGAHHFGLLLRRS